MGETKRIARAEETYEGNWLAFGKEFKRKGQAEKFIRNMGFVVGRAVKYGTRWYG